MSYYRRWHSNQYRPGDWWVICDRSGFKVRASETVQEWNGLRVRREDYDGRHPQDFVRGRRDDQRVPFARPDSDPVFVTVSEFTEEFSDEFA